MSYAVNRYVIVVLLGVFAAGLLAASLAPDQHVAAGENKKMHFTDTVTSAQDPAQGSEGGQLAMILSPSIGTIYDGSMTFASSEPVRAMVLHEISPGDAKGQPTWTIDGETVYGLSLMDISSRSGSFEFTGAALGLYSSGTEQFTATASIDGWMRGQATEIVRQSVEPEKEEPPVLLSKAHVPATIPMHAGLYNGEAVLYIMTDASDEKFAGEITEIQDWRVEVAPMMAHAPQSMLQKIFIFTNGVKSDGLYGYQRDVFSSTPEEREYTALHHIIEVSWKRGQNETVLESVQDVLDAKERGRVEFNETGIIANTPQIVWPGGQMTVRESAEITDEMQYGGGQITDIDRDEMTVTFVAHRGWGPDGRTIYYIVTDATPSGPAGLMGVTDSPSSKKLIASAAASDLFQFQNGIKGPGPLGFQASIAGAALGDQNYSPMWRIYVVEWNDPETAKILETRHDIDSLKQEGLVSVSIARPMNSDHIVNCPFIDPFQ